MTYATQSRTTATSLVERLNTFRAAIADRYASHKIYRATLSELSALTDRDLADLGISRSMIKGIAMEAANTAR